jgi:predicted nucleotidyltransferase
MNFTPIISIMEPDPRILAVYALGSAVRDELRPDSDIDLALLLAPGISFPATEMLSLAAKLTELLGRPVDLGVLSAMNLVYTRQAILAGQCVYRRPFSLAALMAANWLGLYARFQDERREIVNAYATG